MANIKKTSKIFLFICLCVIFSLCLVFAVRRVSLLRLGASVSDGWHIESGYWYYYENGSKKTGWLSYNDFWYYLSPKEQTIGGVNYPKGAMVTKWVQVNRQWYYLSPSEQNIQGVTYKEGSMIKGWFQDENDYWYYLSPTEQTIKGVNYSEGAMVTGWIDLNGWYYLRKEKNDVVEGPKGAAIIGDNDNPTECYEIDAPGRIYCFDKNGKLYNDTLAGPRYKVTPSTLCRVPIDKSHGDYNDNSYKLSGVYFYDHYAVYAAIRDEYIDDVKHEHTYFTLVDLNNNCNVLSKVYAGEIGHSNDITYNSSTNKFYVAEDKSIYEFQIINNQIKNVQKTLSLPTGAINGLAYDSTNNKYFSYHSSNLYKFDSFNSYVENSTTHFNRAPQYYKNFIYQNDNKYYNPWFITQGIDYGNNNLYQVGTISDGHNKLNLNSTEHNSTFVLAYDGSTGSYKYNMHFNKSYGNIHAESLTVDGENMYIGAIEYDSNSNEINNIFYKITGVATIDNKYNTSIRSMEIKKKDNDTVFYKGSPFDYNKITLRLEYNNGDIDYIELNDSNSTVTNFDKDTLGNQTITVTYNNNSYNLNIEVVNKVQLIKPTITSSSLVYNGSTQSPTFKGFDYNTMLIYDGTMIDVGSYTAVISIHDKDKYEWEDGTQDDLEFNWEITKAPIAKPSIVEDEFTYTGNTISLKINGLDDVSMDSNGDSHGMNAADHSFIVTPKANYMWNDGTSDPITFNWKIVKLKLPLPEFDGPNSFVYTGLEITPSYKNINERFVYKSHSTIAKNVGTYHDTFSKSCSDANCVWEDDSTGKVDYEWYITKKQLKKPEFADADPNYEYDGTEHRAYINNYNENYMRMAGYEYATDVGDYPLMFAINDLHNYEWEDGTTLNHIITWSIYKRKIDYPTLSENLFVYTGSEISPQLVGNDLNYLNISGNYYETNAGNYSMILSLKDTSLCEWSDGTSGNYNLNWSIAKAKLDKPTVSGSNTFTYDGTSKGLSFDGLENTMSVTGNSHSEAGTYTTTIGLADDNNYTWSDGTSSGLVFTWTITKADINPTVYMADYYKNATPSIPIVTGNLGNGTVTYSYAAKDSDNYSNNPPTKVGEYKVKAVIAATSNYNGATVTSNFKVLNVEPETIVLPDGSIVKDVGVYGALIDSYNREKGTDYDYTHLFTEDELASLHTLSITEEEYHNVSVNNLDDIKFLKSLETLNINLWDNCGCEKLDLHLNTDLQTLIVKNSPIEIINISNLNLTSIDLDIPNDTGYLITNIGHETSYIKNINDSGQYLITNPSTAGEVTGLICTNYIVNIASDGLYKPAYNIVVLGDIKADGMINVQDISKAYSGLSKNIYISYSNAEKMALDITNDGRKNALDLLRIYSSIETSD